MYKMTFNGFQVEVFTDEMTLPNGTKETVWYAEARSAAGVYLNSSGRTWPTEKAALDSVLDCITYYRKMKCLA